MDLMFARPAICPETRQIAGGIFKQSPQDEIRHIRTVLGFYLGPLLSLISLGTWQ